MNKTELARGLRKKSTDSERLMWELLRDKKFQGFKFRRQHVIRGFVADFYCDELKLALEVDGIVHEFQKDYDALRQEIIEREGVSVLRIDNVDSEGILTLLSQWFDQRKNDFDPNTPSPAGRERVGVRVLR